MTHDIHDLLDVLDLTRTDESVFIGRSSALDLPRVFGGQVAAQALVAAGRTTDGRPPHSLHAYFLRPGDPVAPLRFEVTHLRDGRTVSSRSVDVVQNGRTILRLTASFGDAGTGVAHQVPVPDCPPPERTPTLGESLADLGGLAGLWNAFEAVDIRVAPHAGNGLGRDLIWMRAGGKVPDDPLLHAAVLCYATDLTLLSAALVPHGLRLGRERDHAYAWDTVSLDHALWLHSIPAADDWLLFDQHSPVASNGRALATAQIFSGSDLVASVTQEGLLRGTPV